MGALTGKILGEEFRCKKIAANRIFKGGNVDDGSELDHLTPGVLYYCLESTSKQKFHCASSSFEVLKEHIDINWPAHPLADVFYLGANWKNLGRRVQVQKDRGESHLQGGKRGRWLWARPSHTGRPVLLPGEHKQTKVPLCIL